MGDKDAAAPGQSEGARERFETGPEDEDAPLRYGTWNREGVRAAILRNKFVSCMAGSACVMLFATIVSSALGGTNPARAAPARMCSGGEGNGTLRRLSREAFEFWASAAPPPSDNLVIMLGDGYGPHYHTMARSLRRFQSGNASYMLPLDPFLIGGSITSASSNLITDSAAGATALSCARKTFNGAIGVQPRPTSTAEVNGGSTRVCGDSLGGTISGEACGEARGEDCCPVKRLANTLEVCRARGMATGIVVTTTMPHATPAAWSAHASSRNFKDFIAQQQIEADPPLDVMLGGGRRHFDSRRADGRDLLTEHAGRYDFVNNAQELRGNVAKLARGNIRTLKPLIGLFADEDMNYEVDRLNRPPSGDEQVEIFALV